MNYADRNIERVERQRQEQGEIAAGLHAEGCADAAFGYSPQCSEEPYLDGYFKTIRSRVEKGESLEVKFKSPHATAPHYPAEWGDSWHCAHYEEF